MQINITVAIALMILVASCCFVVVELFASSKEYPMPLTDWVYDTVVKKYPKQSDYFIKQESA